MTSLSQPSELQPRWNGRLARWAPAAWCGLCLALTIPLFVEHVDYFGERLGTLYRWAIVAALAALAVWCAVYVRLRKQGWWKREPRLLLLLAGAFFLWLSPAGLACALLLSAAAFSSGALLLDRAGLTADSPAARLGLSFAAGLGALIVVMIPLGLASAYSPAALWALTLAACLAGWRRAAEIPRLLRELERRWEDSPELESPLAGVAIAVLPAFLAALALAATAPAIAYDAISHHLPAARRYLESGRLEALPIPEGAFTGRWLFTLGHAVGYSHYPQSFEELLTLAWGLGGQPAAQMLTPAICAFSALLLIAIGRLCGVSRLGVVLGASAGFALPFANWIGAIAKNDYLLALFQLASLYALLRARTGGGGHRWLVAGAAFLGLSFGVKHTALFLGWPLGLLLLCELRRSPRILRTAAAMALAFALTGLFWHLRTYLATGNPVFPAAVSRGAQAAYAIDGTMPSRRTIHLTYPWFVHFDGVKTMEGPTRSPAGFYFLFFAPLWLLYRRRRGLPGERTILLALLGFYLYWAWVWGVLRYGLAPVLALALLTGDRLAGWAAAGRGAGRLASAALAYCLCFALLPTLMLEVNLPQLLWAAGRIDREAYLHEALRDYASIVFLNSRVRPGESVLAVNNCSTVYAADPARFRCVRYAAFMRERIQSVGAVVEATDPDYFVAPRNAVGEIALESLTRADWGDPIYEDDFFQVFARRRPIE